jgi:hypothetical protein
MQNYKTLQQFLLGELAMSPERGGEKMPFIAAKGSARTLLGPKSTLIGCDIIVN